MPGWSIFASPWTSQCADASGARRKLSTKHHFSGAVSARIARRRSGALARRSAEQLGLERAAFGLGEPSRRCTRDLAREARVSASLHAGDRPASSFRGIARSRSRRAGVLAKLFTALDELGRIHASTEHGVAGRSAHGL